MARAAKRMKVAPGSDLAALLEEAKTSPVILEKDGELFRLEREEEPADIWAGYDPEKVREAVARYAGSWSDLDTDKLIEDIYRARKEGSRPPNRP